MNIKAKFILTYVAGIVTGIVLLFVVGFFYGKITSNVCIK